MDVNDEIKQRLFGDLTSGKESVGESDEKVDAADDLPGEEQAATDESQVKAKKISDLDKPAPEHEEQNQKLFEDYGSGKITVDELFGKNDEKQAAVVPAANETQPTAADADGAEEISNSEVTEEQEQKQPEDAGSERAAAAQNGEKADAVDEPLGEEQPKAAEQQTVANEKQTETDENKIEADESRPVADKNQSKADKNQPEAVMSETNSIKKMIAALFVIAVLSSAGIAAIFILTGRGMNAAEPDSFAKAVTLMSDYDFIMLCGKGSLPRINYAIQKGANVNAVGNNGTTPLMFAAMNNPDREVISALINAGADVNAKDDDGMAPLMLAARFSSDPEILMTLIEAGADVNARDADGMTPLMAAACSLNHEVLMTLMQKEAFAMGIDPKARDNFGNMAIDYARQRASIRHSDVFWRINDVSH